MPVLRTASGCPREAIRVDRMPGSGMTPQLSRAKSFRGVSRTGNGPSCLPSWCGSELKHKRGYQYTYRTPTRLLNSTYSKAVMLPLLS